MKNKTFKKTLSLVKMKTCRIFLLIFCLVFVFFTSSCDSLIKTNSEHILLHACVYYSVPGFYHSDLKGHSVDVIEKDEFGRMLLHFEGYNNISQNNEMVYVICQGYGNSEVYFYEDINYIRTQDINVCIEELKEQNDWGKELDWRKISKRTVYINFGIELINDCIHIERTTVEEALKNYGFNVNDTLGAYYCDWNCVEQALFVEHFKNGTSIFYIVDSNGNVFVEEIDDPNNCTDDIIRLKEKSGWYKY